MAVESGPILAVTVIDAAGMPVPNTEVTALQLAAQERYTSTTNPSGTAFFTAISTTSWSGVRSITFLRHRNEETLIVFDAPVNLHFPVIPCDGDPCRTVADTLPFAFKPRD